MTERLLMEQHRQTPHRDFNFDVKSRLAIVCDRRKRQCEIAQDRFHLHIAEKETAQVAIPFLRVHHSIPAAMRTMDKCQVRAPYPRMVNLNQPVALRPNRPTGSPVSDFVIPRLRPDDSHHPAMLESGS